MVDGNPLIANGAEIYRTGGFVGKINFHEK
jgi:hypothetical protein